METIKKLTTFKTEGRTFYIVKEQNMYCAIEDKYVTNGKTNRVLWGHNIYASFTMQECLDRVQSQCKVDKLVAGGMDVMDAIKQVVLGVA